MRKTLTTLIALSLLSGCASSPDGEEFSDARINRSGKTQIIIYKAHRNIKVSRDIDVLVNGLPRCILPDDAFLIVDVKPGENTLGFSQWDTAGTSAHTLRIGQGQTTFVKIDYNREKQISGAFGLIGALAADEEKISKPGQFLASTVSMNTAKLDLQGVREISCKKPQAF